MPRFAPLLLAILVGCQSGDDLPNAAYEPGTAALFDAPWPTDARLRLDGTTDLSGFPNPNELPLIQKYIDLASTVQGWGTNSPIFVHFDTPLDLGSLPTPDQSVHAGSSVILVDVDQRSANFGERVPVQWQFTTDSTVYQPENLLAVAPLFGFPLRPDTQYALVITTDVAANNERFAEVWDANNADHERFVGLERALFFLGLERDDVAVATVFTTGEPMAEMADLSRFVKNNVAVPRLSQRVVPLDVNGNYSVYGGDYIAPYFTEGERPYSSEGGGFTFDDAGRPQIAGWDNMRVALCVPNDVSHPPAGGWPVVIQQHGTGGDYRSHCESSSPIEIASQLASVGVVSIGIDQPLHGTRVGTLPASDLDHFNFLNPESGRANFRQGALDAVFLAHALASQNTVFTLPDGTEVPLASDKVMFMGHSQGGLTGGLATPFFGDDVKAVVLSGAGGVLAITVVERKDPLDIANLVESVAQFGEDEHLTELHPLAGLIQQLVEVTDPINYAPYWFSEQGDIEGQRPMSVLLTSGTEDQMTPMNTADALAAAARLPRLDPGDAGEDVDAFRLRAVSAALSPASGNVANFEGGSSTAAFTQWEGLDHWAIWEDDDLAGIYRDFLRDAANGNPTIAKTPR